MMFGGLHITGSPAYSVVLCLMKFTTLRIRTITDLYSLSGIRHLEHICHPTKQPIIRDHFDSKFMQEVFELKNKLYRPLLLR